MCNGIALAQSEVPTQLLERLKEENRLFDRGGEIEVRFLFRSAERILPVWHEGQFKLVRWGCRRGESKVLPVTGWTWQESLEKGHWNGLDPELVEIPATMGIENGIWFRIRQGIRGLLVQGDRASLVVYMLCEHATHYYKTMTRSNRMPVLVGERI
jgi:hypothetical protein